MKDPVVIIGVGEIGGVFARGLLKRGHPVFPVVRGMDFNIAQEETPEPEAVVVAVGEKDLGHVLEEIPSAWEHKLVLLQNELLPGDWQARNIKSPTVTSIWFEKKQPSDYKVIMPSPVYGPKAELVKQAFASINIACKVLASEEELLQELVLKNLYILTTNIAGLEVGGTVGELWARHEALAREVANNVLDIQFKLVGKELDREKLIKAMVLAFEGDLNHKCMGRSAPSRLDRALWQAQEAGLAVKKLAAIKAHHASAQG